MRDQEPLFQKHANHLIASIERNSVKIDERSVKVDLQAVFNCFTLDITSEILFGESFNLLETSTYNDWVSTIHSYVKAMAVMGILGYFPTVTAVAAALNSLIPKRVRDLEQAHYDFIRTRIDRRLDLGSRNEDLWTHAERSSLDALSRTEFRANASILVIAGSETPAAALVGLTYLLLENPDCLVKLQLEICQAFASDDEMKPAALSKLTYLDACIREGLRLYPPSPLRLPRRVNFEAAEICDYLIPRNVGVL